MLWSNVATAHPTAAELRGIAIEIKEGWYANRSEAIRDAVRSMVERKQLARLEAAVEEDIQWGLHGD